MATHLDLGILECEVKWAVGTIIMSKAPGGDRIPAEQFKILKVILLKCFTLTLNLLHFNKFGKLSSGHRTGNHFEANFQNICHEKQVFIVLNTNLEI